VRNGETATVATVDVERGQVTLRTDHNASVTLPGEYLDAGHLTHAYATTIHKAQGLTRDHALVLGTDDLYQENSYVAMSRGRTTNTMYVVDPEPDPELHGSEPEPQDPLDRLAHHLEASRAQRLALDTLDPDSLTRSLTALYAERARLDHHDGDRARAEALGRVVVRQLDGLVEARTLEPPGYLTGALGRPPGNDRALPTWQRGVRIIESYRAANNITDPTDALGPGPNSRAERVAWNDANNDLSSCVRVLRAMNTIERQLDRANTHTIDTPGLARPVTRPGPDLGLDL
jgi:hypothetical protein